MCAAQVSAGCNLRDRDALEARLEEYKEGRAPCDLCSRLNWRCLLQAGQTLPNWPLWTAQRERRGKYVRGALRSLNSVLAMPSLRRIKPKMARPPGSILTNQTRGSPAGHAQIHATGYRRGLARAAQCSGGFRRGGKSCVRAASAH
jgi:hypothetical protein